MPGWRVRTSVNVMRNTSTRALGATVALLAAVALFAPAGAAAAGSGFKVTIAAFSKRSTS